MRSLKDDVERGLITCLAKRKIAGDKGGTGYICGNCPFDKDENGEKLSWDECRQKLFDATMEYIGNLEDSVKLLEGEQ